MSTSNTTMYEWDEIDWPRLERSTFKLQKRIYQAARRHDARAVHKLQKLLIKSTGAALLAVRRVTQDNRGKRTAGIDGLASLNNREKLALFQEIKRQPLVSKCKPVRRVWIPKPGTDDKRPLGIPVMQDRARQALAKMALEPEWEAKFEPNSYGFRPGRSCHDAVQAIWICINQAPKYVLDADIAKCFDRINHAALLDKLGTFPEMRRAIKAWLKAGIMDGGELFPTTEGTPQGGVLTPPTKVQTFATFLAIEKKGEVDSVGNSDLSSLNLNVVDGGAENFSAGVPVGIGKTAFNRCGECFQALKAVLKYLTFCSFGVSLSQRLFALSQLCSCAFDSRIEFFAADHAVAVRVDQTVDGASGLLHLLRQTRPLRRWFTGRSQSAFVLFSQQVGVAKKFAHVVPDCFIEFVRANLFVVADTLAAEAIRVGSHTAIIRPGHLPLRGRTADFLSVVRVAAARTLHQSLKKIAGTAFAFGGLLTIGVELLLYRFEQRFINNRRYGNQEPVFPGCVVGRTGSARCLGMSSLRHRTFATFAGSRLAERRRAFIGSVFQHSPHGGAVPPGLSSGTWNISLFEPTTHFSNRQSIATDPFEHLPHHSRLLFDHFVSRRAVALLLCDVTIAIRSGTEYIHAAVLSRVTFASPRTFQDLRAFVLGEHALHLEQ